MPGIARPSLSWLAGALLLVAAGGTACGEILAGDEAEPPPRTEAGTPGGDAGSGDGAADDSALPDGSAGPDADAGLDAGPCSDDLAFGAVVPLAELNALGDIASVRVSRDGARAIVSVDAGGATYFDLYEGPFPKGTADYFPVVQNVYGELSPTPLVDPLRLYFQRAPLATGSHEIMGAARAQAGDPFGTPVAVPLPVDGGIDLMEPWSVAGKDVLYFTVKPGNGGSRDIYRAEKAGVTWNGGPVQLLSTGLDEGYPVVSDDERTMFFARDISGTDRDIHLTTRASTTAAWESALPVQGINQAGAHDEPVWLSPDKCTLVFTSDRNGALEAFQTSRVR